jgi:uncharacterized membrane protein YdjX (TVP38/TMEM64 family)
VAEWVQAVAASLGELDSFTAVAVFLDAYVVASVTLAPVFVLTIAAGALFGFGEGVVLAFLGATLGSSSAYAIASPLARRGLLAWLDRDPRAAAIRQAVVAQGAWVMFLLRLSPLIPYVALNYALALAGARYRDYLVALPGMLPATAMYAYYGKVIGDVTQVAAGVAPPRGGGYWSLVGLGLVATVVATTLVTRAARRTLRETGVRLGP